MDSEVLTALSFDITEMNPESQRTLDVLEYAQFIYYHFVHHDAKFKIQFSDQSIVRYIEHALFDRDEEHHPVPKLRASHNDGAERTINLNHNGDVGKDAMPSFRAPNDIDLKIFDKMFNAVFRYLHQMTYEPFVIWMNTK